MGLALEILRYCVLAVFAITVASAVVSDWRTLEIPNWTSVTAAVLFLPAGLLAGIGGLELGLHYLTGAGALMLGAAAFARGLVGGGDVKLGAAMVIWTGWQAALDYLVIAALIGGALAVLVLYVRNFPAPFPGLLPGWLTPAAERPVIPYGVAIGLAALAVLPGLAAARGLALPW